MNNAFSEEDIAVIMTLARDLTGTKVTRENHGVIIQNIANRMHEVGCANLEQYLQFVDENDNEMPYLLSSVTIHTTSWFREAEAFEKLESVVHDRCRSTTSRIEFKVLSVACSTGEEIYSIASVLQHFSQLFSHFTYSIEGWDIDPISLRTARTGEYPTDLIQNVSAKHLSKLASISITDDTFTKVKDSVKDNCRFRAVNIIDPPRESSEFDFIMCRNMLIYFERLDVEQIIQYLSKRLKPDGLLCVGVSETSGLAGSGLSPIGQATFKKASGSGVGGAPTPLIGKKLKYADFRGGNILIVEDEEDLRTLMIEYLSSEGYRTISTSDAKEAMNALKTEKIGMILSDFRMPGKNGLEFCKEARSHGFAGPFVIISGGADRKMVQDASTIGCDEVVMKPLRQTDLLRLVRNYIGEANVGATQFYPSAILLGASTGGTEVLAKFLTSLSSQCPPVVVVQHITAGFAEDFAGRLANGSGLTLGEMTQDEVLEKGHIYVPLSDYHVGIQDRSGILRLQISKDAPVHSHRPSVDYLFSSAARTNHRFFAALFTGMGRDGAEGLLLLRRKGSETCAQNEASSTVFGMPKEAIKLNAAVFVGTPSEIRGRLDEILKAKLPNQFYKKASAQ